MSQSSDNDFEVGESNSAPEMLNIYSEEAWPQLESIRKKKGNKKKISKSKIRSSRNTGAQSRKSASDIQMTSPGNQSLPFVPISTGTSAFRWSPERISSPAGTFQKLEQHEGVVFDPTVPPPGYPPVVFNQPAPHAHGQYLNINTSVPPPPFIPASIYSLPPAPTLAGSLHRSHTIRPPPGFAPLDSGLPCKQENLYLSHLQPSINIPPAPLNRSTSEQLATKNKLQLPIHRSASEHIPVKSGSSPPSAKTATVHLPVKERSPLPITKTVSDKLPPKETSPQLFNQVKSEHYSMYSELKSPIRKASSKTSVIKRPQPRSHVITGEKHPPTYYAVLMRQHKIVAKKKPSAKLQCPLKNVSPPQQPTQYENQRFTTAIPNKTVAPRSPVSPRSPVPQKSSNKISPSTCLHRNKRPLYSFVVNGREKKQTVTILPLKTTTPRAPVSQESTHKDPQNTGPQRYRPCSYSLVANQTKTKQLPIIKPIKTITPVKLVRQQPPHSIPQSAALQDNQHRLYKSAVNKKEIKETTTVKRDKKTVRQKPSYNIHQSSGLQKNQFSVSVAPQEPDSKNTPAWRRSPKNQSHSPALISNREVKNPWRSIRRNHKSLFTHACNKIENSNKPVALADTEKQHLPISNVSRRSAHKCDTDRSDQSDEQQEDKDIDKEHKIATPLEPALGQPLHAVRPLDTLRKFHPYLFIVKTEQHGVRQNNLYYIRPWRYLPNEEPVFQQSSARRPPVPPLELDSEQPEDHISGTYTYMPGPQSNQFPGPQVFRHPAAELYQYMQSIIGLPDSTEQSSGDNSLSPRQHKSDSDRSFGPKHPKTKQSQTTGTRTELPRVTIKVSEARKLLHKRHMEWLGMQQSEKHADTTETSDEMRALRPPPQFQNAPWPFLSVDMASALASTNEAQAVRENGPQRNHDDFGEENDPSASGNGSAFDSN